MGEVRDEHYSKDFNADADLMLKKHVPEYNPQNDVYKTVLEEGEGS